VSRVLQNACYARGDTAGPARIAAVRVAVAAAIGTVVMFPLDRIVVGSDGLVGAADALGLAWALPASERALDDVVRLGAVGLALGSAVAAWTEIAMLSRRFGFPDAVRSALGAPAAAAAISFAVTAALKLLVSDWPSILSAPLVAAAAILVYAVVALRSGVAEAHLLLQPLRRALWTSRD